MAAPYETAWAYRSAADDLGEAARKLRDVGLSAADLEAQARNFMATADRIERGEDARLQQEAA
jgi:hypothetical protein